MKTSPALRWTCYGIAAVATAAAMWHVDQRADGDSAAVQPAHPIKRGATPPLFATSPASAPDALDVLKRRLDAAISGGADPFSDAGRAAAAAAAVQATAPAAAAVPAAPVAAVVPYAYVGRWQEQGQTVVFLQAGERVLSVSGPGPLDGRYVVESVEADKLTLKSVAGGERLTVPFVAAAPSAAPDAQAQAPAQTATASSPPGTPEEN
jgi:hypothetical protein